MQGTVDHMLISLHEHFPVRITDWLLSAILLSWGVALSGLDPKVWDSAVYGGLNWASQGLVSAFAIALGVARIGALFVNGAIRRSPHLRLAGAFLSIFIWVQISLGMLYTGLNAPAVALYPWLAFADMFNVYRAAMDARVSDTRARQKRSSVARRVSPST